MTSTPNEGQTPSEPSSPAEELRKAASAVMRPPSGLAIGWTLRRPLHELLGFMLDARKAKDQGIDLIEHTTAYYRGETGCVKDCAGCELEHLALNLARAINGSDSE